MYRVVSLLTALFIIGVLVASASAQWRYVKLHPDLKLSQVEFVRGENPAIKGIIWNAGTGPAEGVMVTVTDEANQQVGSATVGYITLSGNAAFNVPIQGLSGTHQLKVAANPGSGTPDMKPEDNVQTVTCELPGGMMSGAVIAIILIAVCALAGIGYYLCQGTAKPKRPAPRPPGQAPTASGPPAS